MQHAEYVVTMWRDGLSAQMIGALVHSSPNSVHQHLRLRGESRTTRGANTEAYWRGRGCTLEDIETMWLDGLSEQHIADLTRISRGRVQYRVSGLVRGETTEGEWRAALRTIDLEKRRSTGTTGKHGMLAVAGNAAP